MKSHSLKFPTFLRFIKTVQDLLKTFYDSFKLTIDSFDPSSDQNSLGLDRDHKLLISLKVFKIFQDSVQILGNLSNPLRVLRTHLLLLRLFYTCLSVKLLKYSSMLDYHLWSFLISVFFSVRGSYLTASPEHWNGFVSFTKCFRVLYLP